MLLFLADEPWDEKLPGTPTGFLVADRIPVLETGLLSLVSSAVIRYSKPFRSWPFSMTMPWWKDRSSAFESQGNLAILEGG